MSQRMRARSSTETSDEASGRARARPPTHAVAEGSMAAALCHLLVVGGTHAEWAALSDTAWAGRADALGELCSRLGVRWLTIRAYQPGDPPAADDLTESRVRVGTCDVVIDPCCDGRQRFVDKMAHLDPEAEVNEATVASLLYEPAECEPDLVVVLGPPTQLPPSLVWELAYAELVFVPVAWSELTADHVERAIDDFAHRNRRFGGLDDG